jgi:hypothetical protein
MRKNIKKPILLISILVLSIACRKPLKDVEDYFPKVKTISAIVQDDGTVKVTGEIESAGKTKNAVIDYAGFCLSTNPEPKMLQEQLLVDLSGTTFTGIYPAALFNIDSTYYFRTWATNEYGYSYGNAIRLDSIITPTLTPPCTLAMNMLNIGASTSTVYYDVVGAPDSDNSFSAYSFSGGPTISFQFGSALTTGIFKTSPDQSPDPGQVHIRFSSGSLSAGSNVYVNRLSANKFEVTVCEAPWSIGSGTAYFNTHFITPL